MRFMTSFFIMLNIYCSIAMATGSEHETLLNGKLVGKAAEQEVINFTREFQQYSDTRKKLLPLYQRYIDKIGVRRIARVLESDSVSCHGVAHSLGGIIGARTNDLSVGMKICGATCTYACLHGVFKVYFNNLGKDYHEHSGHHENKVGDEAHQMDKNTNQVVFTDAELKQFSQDANNACDKSDSIVSGFFQGNCAHGVGHAIAKLAGNAVLANTYCKLFSRSDMQYYCETGVFMELSSKIKDQLFTKKLKRSEKIKTVLSYCGKESRYPTSCLRFLLPRNKSLGHITRYAFLCSKQEGVLRSHCFNALGYHSRTYLGENPSEIIYACNVGNKMDQDTCISGIALMKKGQRYRQKIKAACLSYENDHKEKFCLDQVTKYYYHLDNNFFSELMIASK